MQQVFHEIIINTEGQDLYDNDFVTVDLKAMLDTNEYGGE